MKKVTVLLTGLVFVSLGIFLLGICPGAVHAQQSEADIHKHIMPASNCPPGQWDANYGRCKQAPQEQPASEVHKQLIPASSTCPPGKWNANYGKCGE